MTPADLDEPTPVLPQPPLAPGFLACVPLFLLYELGVALGGDAAGRSSAELLLGRALLPLGEHAYLVRWAALVVAGVFALVHARRDDELSLRRSAARMVGEGLVAGVVLGPLLVTLLGVFESLPPALPVDGPRTAPPLYATARIFGGAAWEELVFRVGVYGLVFLLVSHVARFFGAARGLAGPLADGVALLGSSLLFAAFHLEPFQRWLVPGGESYEPSIFVWRTVAGLLLGALYRWRGLAVAAWAHGLFNLGLALGAGPGVFR